MPSILMPLGVLIITYWVSRAALAGLKRFALEPLPRLLIAHGISFAVCATFVMTVGFGDPFAPFPYLAAQAFWLAVDWLRGRLDNAGGKRRRRRSSKSGGMASGTYRPQGGFSIPNWLVPAAMCLATVGYTGFGWKIFSYGATTYHDVMVGSSPEEAIYAAGKPVFGRNSDTEQWRKIDEPRKYAQWMYQQPLMTIRFSADHRVQDIRCTNDDKLSQSSCIQTLSLGIGSSEGQLYAMLGMPSSGGTTADGKRIASYPELGHDFVLEQFYVRGLRVGPANGNVLATLWRFFLWLVP